ncbi:MAG: hemerythrin domain-containing protein [Bacillota bacterium]
MDPIELITEDHRRIQALLDEYEAYGEDAYIQKQELVDSIIDELEAHTEMEETIAYPAFREAFDTEGDKKIEEAYAEHDVAKNLIEELRGLDPQDPQFDAKLVVLRESVMHHMEEEESSLLPSAETSMSGEDMARIGEEMKAFKDARDDAALDALSDLDDDAL